MCSPIFGLNKDLYATVLKSVYSIQNTRNKKEKKYGLELFLAVIKTGKHTDGCFIKAVFK